MWQVSKETYQGRSAKTNVLPLWHNHGGESAVGVDTVLVMIRLFSICCSLVIPNRSKPYTV